MVLEFPKYYFMKTAFLFFILMLGSMSSLFAQSVTPVVTESAAVSSPVPTVSPSKSVGEGSFGLGVSQISVTPFEGLSPSADSIFLFDIRYWLSNQFILEVLAGGTAGTQLGSDAFNNPIDDPYWAYCYGLGIKTNLAEPFDGLLVQCITHLLYLQNSSQKSNSISVYTDQYQYLSVSIGLGFEYFLPFLKNLSLETSANLEFDENWENYTATPRNTFTSPTVYTPSTYVFKVTTPGFNLTSISIHYYF
jgi:hypothetical protein